MCLSVHSVQKKECFKTKMEMYIDNPQSSLDRTYVYSKDGGVTSLHQVFKNGLVRVIKYQENGAIRDVVIYYKQPVQKTSCGENKSMPS